MKALFVVVIEPVHKFSVWHAQIESEGMRI